MPATVIALAVKDDGPSHQAGIIFEEALPGAIRDPDCPFGADSVIFRRKTSS